MNKNELAGKIELCTQFVIAEVIEIIADRYKIADNTVIKMMYMSRTYEMMMDKKTKLWTESPYYIAEDFEKELKLKKV